MKELSAESKDMRNVELDGSKRMAGSFRMEVRKEKTLKSMPPNGVARGMYGRRLA